MLVHGWCRLCSSAEAIVAAAALAASSPLSSAVAARRSSLRARSRMRMHDADPRSNAHATGYTPELRRRLGRAYGLTVAAPRGSGAGGCPCTCVYGTDPGCQCRSLPAPLNITLTKTPTVAVYPLTYLQSFDEQPFEARPWRAPARRLTRSAPC